MWIEICRVVDSLVIGNAPQATGHRSSNLSVIVSHHARRDSRSPGLRTSASFRKQFLVEPFLMSRKANSDEELKS